MKFDCCTPRTFLAIAFWAGCLATSLLAEPPANGGRQPDRGRTTAPEGTKVLRDLEYARVGNARLLLDLYLPENPRGPVPVIVGIHGGGWANGSKEGGQGSWLARHGYAVAVINYRLSGEAIFPAQIEDCKAAVRWLRANARKYGLNADRIGATGHSAGGHLASLLATTGDVREFDKGENLEYSSRIQAACSLAGPTDLLQMDAHAPPGARLKHDSPGSPEARLIGGPIQENKEKAARANPIAYVTKDDPPLLIVHGDQDTTVPWHQARLLYEALKQAGVSVHFHTVEGAGHGLGGREVNELIAAFFDRHLRGTGPADAPTAETSKSKGTDAPPNLAGNRPLPLGLTWERVREREDADQDGKVTREEFKGPPPLFDRLDRNRDGVLTLEDFHAAPLLNHPAKDEPKPVNPADETPGPEVPGAQAGKSSREVRPPVGLFVCRGPSPTPEREVNFPFIDGWLVRPGWDKVEPQEGNFDWTYIDNEIALAKKLKKRITLCVLGGPQTPDWVYDAGASSFAFRLGANRKYGRKSDRDVRIPVLWDETYLAKWTALVRELGRRYDREEAVVLIHITGATGNGLEMQLPFGPEDRKNWDRLGYTPEKAIKAWQRIIDAFADAFPSKPLDIDIHPVLGSDEVAAEVAAYGSKKLAKRFGVFGGWLSGKDASQDRHHAGMHALAAIYGPLGFAAFQMIGNETRQPERFAKGGLKAAIEQAMSWNARYFEVWQTDAMNEELHPMLKEMAAKLKK
ncbi:MAG: alpha/beta hydrolase fold domain-containing protein [Thermogutta sp.]|nr:alpha/beta hydrolase fold domain-containing protein [Thermogutta sp.]